MPPIFQAATERGLIAVPEPRPAAEQLVGMIRDAGHRCRLLNVRGRTDPEPARFAGGVVDVFLRAYTPAYASALPSGQASDAPKAGAETPALGNIGP